MLFAHSKVFAMAAVAGMLVFSGACWAQSVGAPPGAMTARPPSSSGAASAPVPDKPVLAKPAAPTPPAEPVAAAPAPVPSAAPVPAPAVAMPAPVQAQQAEQPKVKDACEAYKVSYEAYVVCQDRMRKIQRMIDAQAQRDKDNAPPPPPVAAKTPTSPAAAVAGTTPAAGTAAAPNQPGAAGQGTSASAPAAAEAPKK